MAPDEEITALLAAVGRGDQEAANRLMPLVYDELRTIAHRQLRRLRPGETLNTTALAHEVYLNLIEPGQVDWRNRAHFLALMATAARYIVVDHARQRSAQKRGGGVHHTPLDAERIGAESRAVEILALDQALERLGALNERLARVVELRFFGGLTEKEAGAVLGISERSVRREWRKARAFLSRTLEEQPQAP